MQMMMANVVPRPCSDRTNMDMRTDKHTHMDVLEDDEALRPMQRHTRTDMAGEAMR
jgi:hypothetical protein